MLKTKVVGPWPGEVTAQRKLLKVHVVSGGREEGSMWSSISLDSPAGCQ